MNPQRPFAPGALIACALLARAWCALPGFAQTPPPRPPANRIACGMLVYAGNKTGECFSERFLTRTAEATTVKPEPHFHPVRLDGAELMDYPFCVMSGSGAFKLTPPERQQLRRYIEQGGFLLASASCSDAAWAKSFRGEWARLFPKAPMKRLTLSHPLFHIVYRIDTLATIHGQNGASGARIEAWEQHGRLRMIFAPDGLNDTPHASHCCCCGGDEAVRAEFINTNILVYALTH